MRNLALTLALLAGASSLRAQTAPPASLAPTPFWLGDPGVDVEKARAHRQEQKADWLHWEEATTAGDYERVGRKDPRWDADVHIVFDEVAHALARVPDSAARVAAAKAPCQRALTAGCDDPLLAYDALRVGVFPAGTSPRALARRYGEVEQNLEKSGYSPVRKLSASLRTAQQWARVAGSPPPPGETDAPDARAEADAALSRAQSHLIELLRDPTANRNSVSVIADDLFRTAEHDPHGQAQVFAVLEIVFDSGLLKEAGETATAKLIEGQFWVLYAWQGRTTKYAHELTDENLKPFEERLAKAQAALERAYALDPSDRHIPYAMMSVELGQGEGRDRLETWFRRAMDVDPDDYAACAAKLYYLEPKWYGDDGRCSPSATSGQATANWAARLPYILPLAHAKLASYEDTPPDYWKKPEVWADLQQFYRAALAAPRTRSPTAAPMRSPPTAPSSGSWPTNSLRPWATGRTSKPWRARRPNTTRCAVSPPPRCGRNRPRPRRDRPMSLPRSGLVTRGRNGSPNRPSLSAG